MLAVVATAFTLVMFTSCRDTVRSWLQVDKTLTNDTAFIVSQVESIVNPSFSSADEFITHMGIEAENKSLNEAIESMPHSVLRNVATVVLQNNGCITKQLVLNEYNAHKNVYDNLPQEQLSAPNDQKQDSIDGTNRKIISTSYRYRTDTVNGQHRKVQIKTEESYD